MKSTFFKYISWVVLGVLLVSGLSISLYFSTQPRPIPKIRYSLFASPSELGTALTQRLRLEIKQANLIFFGIDPLKSDQYEIILGALELLRAEGGGIDVIVVDPNLPYKAKIPHQEEIELQAELDRFSEGITAASELGKKVVVILPSIYGTTLLDNSPVSKYLASSKAQSLIFTISSFPTSQEEEKGMIYPCVPDQVDRLGTRNLGCMIVSKAKTLYRKKNSGSKRAGLVDQIGVSEYLVLFN